MNRVLHVGTRESKLARLQTDLVIEELKAQTSGCSIEIVPIGTMGDKTLSKPLHAFGGIGVFVKELEEALLAGKVDLVVHSLKDLPTEIPPKLCLAATLLRADPRDVFISRIGVPFEAMPAGSRIATSSRRRTAQLLSVRGDLQFCDIRGNVPTRLRKLDEGQCDGMVLAAAGLIRLGLQDRITHFFEPDISVPAAGQGALAVECRDSDNELISMLSAIADRVVQAETAAERSFLRRLGGGCSVPIGVLASGKPDGSIELSACVADYKRVLRSRMTGRMEDAAQMGAALAEQMLADGAGDILATVMRQAQPPISPP